MNTLGIVALSAEGRVTNVEEIVPEPELERLVPFNEPYAERFDEGGLSAPPRRRLAVLTCMDARLDPMRFCGLGLGDAHVIRNAGGRASEDAIRSLVASVGLLGVREVAVVHHTDCGIRGASNDELQARVAESIGVDAGGIDFLPLPEIEEGIRSDVDAIRSSPIGSVVRVAGFVYDVRTGRLSQV